jgi:hypothetical protein
MQLFKYVCQVAPTTEEWKTLQHLCNMFSSVYSFFPKEYSVHTFVFLCSTWECLESQMARMPLLTQVSLERR